MRIYSEKTNKEYKTVEECQKAEDQWEVEQAAIKAKQEKLAITRKERAAEVDAAYKAVEEARKHYNEVLNAFLQDYHQYHVTYKLGDGGLVNLFESLFTW